MVLDSPALPKRQPVMSMNSLQRIGVDEEAARGLSPNIRGRISSSGGVNPEIVVSHATSESSSEDDDEVFVEDQDLAKGGSKEEETASESLGGSSETGSGSSKEESENAISAFESATFYV